MGLQDECVICGAELPKDLEWYERGRWLKAHIVLEHSRAEAQKKREQKLAAFKERTAARLKLAKAKRATHLKLVKPG